MLKIRLLQAAIPVALLVAWQTLAPARELEVFVSTPEDVGRRLIELGRSGELWTYAGTTVRTALLGLAIGSLLGITVGIVLAGSQRIFRVVNPFVAAAYSFPRIILFPLFLVWFGPGEKAGLFLVALITFFLMMVNTIAGMKSIDTERFTTVRLLGASRLQLVKVVMLPSLLPFILSGIGMTVPAAFLGAIVGEILGGRSGVGYLIERSAGQFDSAGMMAGVVVVGFMGALATLCIARPAEKYLERMGAR
jgi:NitT/TauT family transport system permease protein